MKLPLTCIPNKDFIVSEDGGFSKSQLFEYSSTNSEASLQEVVF